MEIVEQQSVYPLENPDVLRQFQATNGVVTNPTTPDAPVPLTVDVSAEDEGGASLLDYAVDIAGGLVSSPMAAANEAVNLAQWVVNGGEEAAEEDKWGQLWEYDTKTAAGGIAKEIGTFLAGFGAGGAVLKGAKILQGTTKIAAWGRGAAKGAFSDFMTKDGHEERLSNLLHDNPGLLRPVVEALEADEKDNEVWGRLKNAAEGMLLGGLVDSFIAAVRGVKSLRAAKTPAEVEAVYESLTKEGVLESATKATDEVVEAAPVAEAMKEVGPDAVEAVKEAPLIPKDADVSTSIKEAVTEAVAREDDPVRGVFASINTTRHFFENDGNYHAIKAVADTVYDQTIKGKGVETHEKVLMEGIQEVSDMGLSLDALLQKGYDSLENLEKSARMITEMRVAFHQLINEGSEIGLAVKNGSASEQQLYVFSRLADYMQEVGRVTKDLQTGAARGTSAGKIVVTDDLTTRMFGKESLIAKDMTFAKNTSKEELFADMKNRGWDEEKLQQFAADLQASNGDVRKVGKLMNNFNNCSYLGVLNEFRINNLLSGPLTIGINAVGNVIKTAWLPMDQIVGGALMGDTAHMAQGWRMYGALTMYMRDSLSMAGKAFMTGDSILDRAGSVLSEAPSHQIGYENLKALRNRTLGREPTAELTALEEILCRQANWMGTTIRLPSRLLLTTDEFFKQMNFRASLHSKMYDLALENGMKTAEDIDLFIKNGMSEALDASTGMAKVVKGSPVEAALQYARKSTWSESLGAGTISGDIQSFATKHPGFRVIVPFIKTPANILRDFRAHTPLLNLASSNYRAALQQGGEARAVALGQMATGTVMWSTAIGMAMEGSITGSPPRDPKLRKMMEESGWQPYSVRVGDTYYSYRRYDPIGMFLGLAADFAAVAEDFSEQTGGETAAAMSAAIVNNLASKTYLQGVTETLELIQDPGRYFKPYAGRQLSTLVPMASMLRFVRQQKDDPMREMRDIMDYVMNTLPGYSKELPARRSWLTGETVNYRMFPTANDSTTMKELENMAQAVIGAPMKTLHGVELTSAQYSRMNELHGTVRINGRTMMQSLERLFQSGSYDINRLKQGDPPDKSQGQRAYEINKIIKAYRNKAQDVLLSEDRELMANIDLEYRKVKLSRSGKLTKDNQEQVLQNLMTY